MDRRERRYAELRASGRGRREAAVLVGLREELAHRWGWKLEQRDPEVAEYIRQLKSGEVDPDSEEVAEQLILDFEAREEFETAGDSVVMDLVRDDINAALGDPGEIMDLDEDGGLTFESWRRLTLEQRRRIESVEYTPGEWGPKVKIKFQSKDAAKARLYKYYGMTRADIDRAGKDAPSKPKPLTKELGEFLRKEILGIGA